ncbi:hypothetical protein OIO90_005700 [Microbotryomycetes sp. JL221]|nr:hypothetical protein OIO90_005700 [Microbotryomycetes sp. JL221]
MTAAAATNLNESHQSGARKHVTRSCVSCRRRKVKCSAEQPCSSCILYNEDCSYDAGKHDGRKNASKAYVAALEQRVKELEALLAATKAQTSGFGTTNDVQQSTAPSKQTNKRDGMVKIDEGSLVTDAASPEGAELSAGVEQLRIDDSTGEYRLYGHSSAYMHLPTPHASVARSNSSTTLPLRSLPPGLNTTLTGKRIPSNTFLCPSHPTTAQGGVLSPATLTSMSEFELGIELDIATFDIDWSLNLPNVPNFDRQVHDDIIGLWLNFGNDWLRFVNATRFLSDLRTCLSRTNVQGRPIRTPYYSPLLHNSMLAVAAAFSSHSIDAEIFATRAKSLIEDENEVPLCSSVQGLFLLAEYYAGSSKPKKGWLFYGIGNYSASNLGLAVSLHPLAEKGLIAAQVKDEREATFATWLLLDKLWSCLLGRQPILFRRTYETSLPNVDPMIDARRWYPDWKNKAFSMPSYSSTTHRFAASLVDVLERILETFYAFRASLYSVRVIEKVSAFHVFWFVLILLHRPYFSRPEGKPSLEVNKTAVQQCERAASKIVNLLEMHRQLPSGLRFSTVTLTQVSFLSGTVHILSAINASTQNAHKKFDSAVALARSCVGHLDEMGQSWKCASSSADILRRLIVEWCVRGGVPDGVPHASGVGFDDVSGKKRRRLTGDDNDEPRDLHRKFWDSFVPSSNATDSCRLDLPPSKPMTMAGGGRAGFKTQDLPVTFDDVAVESATDLRTSLNSFESSIVSSPTPHGSLQDSTASTIPSLQSSIQASVPSFTRYHPPTASLPSQFEPLFASSSVSGGSLGPNVVAEDLQVPSFFSSPSSGPTTATASTTPGNNDNVDMLLSFESGNLASGFGDPFSKEDYFAVFQGQDQWSQLGNMTLWSNLNANDPVDGVGGGGGDGVDTSWLDDLNVNCVIP